jgi:hypothetical protein
MARPCTCYRDRRVKPGDDGGWLAMTADGSTGTHALAAQPPVG